MSNSKRDGRGDRANDKATVPISTAVDVVVAPTLEAWEWQLRGRCRGMPTEIFFTAEQDKGRRRLDHEKRAKRICQTCPVLNQCRQYAVAAAEPYGIWGATTPQERRDLRRRFDSEVVSAS